MDKLVELFDEFVMKAIVLTESVIEKPVQEDHLESFTSNRERLFQIIDTLSKQIDWNLIAEEPKAELTRKIDYIKKLDEKLLVKLQEHQRDVKQDLERTHRNGEGLKGYNLNDVK